MSYWKPERLPAEVDGIKDIMDRLFAHRQHSPLVGTCFMTARALNLSREETLALLAYHAVRMYEESFDREVERVMLHPVPPFIVTGNKPSPTAASEEKGSPSNKGISGEILRAEPKS